MQGVAGPDGGAFMTAKRKQKGKKAGPTGSTRSKQEEAEIVQGGRRDEQKHPTSYSSASDMTKR